MSGVEDPFLNREKKEGRVVVNDYVPYEINNTGLYA